MEKLWRLSRIVLTFALACTACSGTEAANVGTKCAEKVVMCPAGTKLDMSANASSECSGKGNADLTDMTGNLSGVCRADGTCNVKCIGLADAARARPKDERYAAVDVAVCLGCGACIGACEHEAIRLVPRPHAAIPPKNRNRMFVRILWEKGRLGPFLMDGAKQRWRKAVAGIGKS